MAERTLMMYRLLTLVVFLTAGLTDLVKAEGYVSFTFDDASRSQAEVAFPLLEQAKLPATLYVAPSLIDSGDDFFMTWEQVKTIARSDWEIGAHSSTHPHLPTLTDKDMFYELAYASFRLKEEVGYWPVSFASPYGEYNETTLRYAKTLYQNHVMAWGEVNPASVDPYLIERINVDGTLTAESICRMVQTVGEKGWLVLMFHQIGEPSGPYIIAPKQLEKIVRCVNDRVTTKEIKVGTVSTVNDWLHKKEKEGNE